MARSLRLGLLAFAAAFAASACFGSDDEPTSYVELLRWVPNEPEYRREIWVMDYEAIRTLPPPDGLDPGSPPLVRLAATAQQHIDLRLVPPLGSQAALVWPEIPEHWEQGFGFTIDDIDRSLSITVFSGATVEEVGFHSMGVISGRFDPRAVPARLEACGECAQPTVNHHLRQSYYSWREGLSLSPEDRLRPPIFDNLGQGGHIVLTNDHILFELSEDPFRAALEARLEGSSVLEDDAFRLIAEELDRQSLLAVVISGEPQSPAWARTSLGPIDAKPRPHERLIAVFDPPDSEAQLHPYDAFALGAAWDASGPYTTVVLAHRTDEDATANVTRLLDRLEQTTGWLCIGEECGEQAWSDIFTSWEVEADGRLLTATLRGAARWTILYGAEPLILHE